ncbi:CdaR family transcriptional regulator [Pseudonocardia sp. WMMC193]|uniref:PucR family transcriptional regulator n=1 Tax=Pseudonocardia sp. WMMC193 TaxID=2911965 RepID=UPI001F3D1A64|nr:helix-turn-helix domain-containing protein [Pseudonocardia sp. WMMC193]MCF7552305.1 helix-turn-helix domain-containing protein [Pseudonocardia sp. WMMC193]
MGDRQELGALRAQLSSISDMFALVMIMFDSADEAEILRLALSSVATLGPFRAEGAHLARRETPDGDDELSARLRTLAGAGGSVAVDDRPWSWAFPMRAVGSHAGYLVVSAGAEPPADKRSLLSTLAQLTGAALVSAGLHRRERDASTALSALNTRLEGTNEQLTAAVTDLEWRDRIHQSLMRVAASGTGPAGIAAGVHQLTGMAVAVEDPFGNLVAWAGPDRPHPYPRPRRGARAELLSAIRRSGRAVRSRDRVLAVAQPRDEVLGVLSLVDPGRRAGDRELFALEHGALVLATELAHQRGLAETELRLRRDLGEDLITGTDDVSARARSLALGHDLHPPHQVLVARWADVAQDEEIVAALGTAATRVLGAEPLTARRGGAVVLVVPQPDPAARMPWGELHRAAASLLRSPNGSIGVGRPRALPSELPQSLVEGERALEVRLASATTGGVTTFEELGIYRLLAAGAGDEVGGFVREWLGPLIDYDAANRSALVTTLWQYYECGGNYDATARALTIHRSTLRYRLQRIRELSGHDLRDVESRLNLHVAARAWQILRPPS